MRRGLNKNSKTCAQVDINVLEDRKAKDIALNSCSYKIQAQRIVNAIYAVKSYSDSK